jgi:hypothetical protein
MISESGITRFSSLKALLIVSRLLSKLLDVLPDTIISYTETAYSTKSSSSLLSVVKYTADFTNLQFILPLFPLAMFGIEFRNFISSRRSNRIGREISFDMIHFRMTGSSALQ